MQAAVECVPDSQSSPAGNSRGIRVAGGPSKKERHKTKASSKDPSTNKKKRNSWIFRLNCRLKQKSDTEQETASENVGCVPCVCPSYRQSETEPVYRSVVDNASSSNSIPLHSPIIDFSRLGGPDRFPIPVHDLEDEVPQERHVELAMIDPADIIPNPLTLPLHYNNMLRIIQCQALFERLRVEGVPYSVNETLFSQPIHTQVDYIHCLVPDLLAITNCGFYWGKMDRYEAESLLENKAEGTFLLRDSSQEEYQFSVSFRRYERSLHARIEQWNHKFSFDSHEPGVFASPTVCGLIEHYKDASCCMFFEPLLTNPLKRTFPFSLQHMSRANICSRTSYEGINRLELPKSLKNYLKEYHYKQKVRVRHLD